VKKEKPTALFIGRFQPFHKGHLHAIRWIAKRSGKVLVAVGSSQLSHELQNPFTSNERLQMLKIALSHGGLSGKCTLFALKDIKENSKWVRHVEKGVPSFDRFYSNNPLALKLMKNGGVTTCRIPFLRREDYQAQIIRKKMRKSESWASRVPTPVASYLKKIKAEERVRQY
jgi:nicotinamide-nucleotide adenylyltransferase